MVKSKERKREERRRRELRRLKKIRALRTRGIDLIKTAEKEVRRA